MMIFRKPKIRRRARQRGCFPEMKHYGISEKIHIKKKALAVVQGFFRKRN